MMKRKFVWIEMPEGRYLARVSWHTNQFHRVSFDIEMVDPVPNKLGDECYGSMFSMARGSGLKDGVRHFIADMKADRKKYGWNGKRLVRARTRRLEELAAILDEPSF